MPSDIIEISRISAEVIRVPIIGTAPLIVHRFSEKAKRQMLDNMQGRKTPKTAKNPEEEYDACLYKFADGSTGFPVIAFKAATVGAARFYDKSVSMVGLRQQMFFRGEFGVDSQMLAKLDGEYRMREDVTRVGNGGADLRYRPEYLQWSTTLEVTYVASLLTQGSVLSLIDAGGLGVGVGEWRPERKGDFGTYRVDSDRDIEVVG